jgi:predicted component of type VI protein secretion system
MKYTLIILTLCLVGCSTTVPVTAKFPDIPEKLLVRCPNLQKVNDDVKLSDVAKTVTVNYSTYYDCAVKHDGIVEWYQIQKKIYESVK